MGKSTKPTKWFKAVKKAFRSPSKERPPPDHESPKADQGDEKLQLLTKHDFPPQAHPLPLFESISHDLVGSERVIQTPQKVLLLPQPPNSDEKKVPEQEEETHDHQLGDVGDDATFSEEEEEEKEATAATTTIQQRFLTIPLALEGLVRLQALVRGHLVRRHAAATLRTMKAIVRVQALFRGRRVRMSEVGRAVRSRTSRACRHSSRITNGTVHDANKVEIVGSEAAEQEEASKRKRTTAHLINQQLKRTTPNHSSSIDFDSEKGWAWLELWTKTRPWDHNNMRQGDSDSKDSYIEINPNQSQYTTKEVDVNTKVKYYEDYISDLALKKTNFSSRLMKKEQFIPMQIEVPDTKEEDQKASTPVVMMTPSSSLNSAGDGGSDAASVCHVQEIASTQAGSDAASFCHVPAREGVAMMEQLVVHHVGSNGGADPALSDSLSVYNGVHVHEEDHALGLASDDIANGHITSKGHSDNQLRGKEENHVTTGSKSRGVVTCRYMAATKSAKAKFRSSSNPKSRTNPESPTTTKRYSTGSSSGPTNQSPKLVTRDSNNRRRSPSPVVPKKIHNLSPAKRNSLGGDGKRWRT